MALLQKRMSRCLDVVKALPETLRASGQATLLDYSISLLNYLYSADQYLTCAARVLPAPLHPLDLPLVPQDGASADTVGVLQDLLDFFLQIIYGEPGPEGIRYGCSDYHDLLCNIINTFIAHHNILHPLLQQSSWDLLRLYRGGISRFCLRLANAMDKEAQKEAQEKRGEKENEKENEKGRTFSSPIGAQLRYQETDTTSNNLTTAIDRYINLYKYVCVNF